MYKGIFYKGVQIKNFDELYQILPSIIKQKLSDNKKLRENPKYHPEDNAFEHIKIVTNRLFDTDDINMILTGLFHDICKMESAKPREDSEYFLCQDHEKKAVGFLLRHVSFIHEFENADLGKIVWLVNEHMRIKLINEMKGAKRDEIVKNKWYRDLVVFSAADSMNTEWHYQSLARSIYREDNTIITK